MKNRFLFLILGLSAAVFLLDACKPKEDENEDLINTYNRRALLQNLSDNYIVPGYSGYSASVLSLESAYSVLVANPTAANLDVLKSSYKALALNWQKVAFLEFGPAEDISLRAQTNVYPVDTSLINSNITSGSFNVCLGTDAGSNQLVSGDNQLYIARAGSAAGNDAAFLYGNGSGQLQNGDNNANFITTSDRRIKKNITDSSVGLAEINQVQIRNFEYRTFDELDNEVKALNDGKGLNVIGKTGTQTGVIAQELQAILPSEVEASNDGTLSVKHENLNWALIKAVQELSTALDAAVARIATLEG